MSFMKKNILKLSLAYFASAFVLVSTAAASEKTLVLGGKNGWNDFLVKKGITTGQGRFGFDAVQLSSQTQTSDKDTELLLLFENGKVSDFDGKGNYRIIENNLLPVKDAAKGTGAALSRGEKKGLVLKKDKSPLSGSYVPGNSFSVEFWISPSLAENGEKIYSWQTSINYSKYTDFQTVSAVFLNNRIEWRFLNVFPGLSEREVVLKGSTPVIPQKWSRHTVSFDEETGCLEYLVDGKTEDIKFITSTRHESGTVCTPVIGKNSTIEICPSFTGKIDSVCIKNAAYKGDENILVNGNEAFKAEGGRFETSPILVSRASSFDSLEGIVSVPAQTELKFFVRAGDNCYGWTENYPEWKEISLDEKIEGVSGQYFQIASELLPDGNCQQTPKITELTVKYTEPETPLPPFFVKAVPGDGEVTLSWRFSIDDNAGGYYVYYGSKPGEYLGRAAIEGVSPVNAGNSTSITLTGLNNGTIYYFAVSTYSKLDENINGELSNEVFARPSKRLAKK